MKEFLIFSGVGDVDKQYLSWAKDKSELYDRAINYYGDSEEEYSKLNQIDPEFLFKTKGMVFNCFAEQYHLFNQYKYILVCDGDLVIPPRNIENTLKLAKNNNWAACTWGREQHDYSDHLELKSVKTGIRKSNFIEMTFMLIRKDLLDLLVDEWNKLDLQYSTGVDLVLANVAYHAKILPFYIVDDYRIYNPHPHEKKDGRELHKCAPSLYEDRMHKLIKIIKSNPEHWKSLKRLVVDNKKMKLSNDITNDIFNRSTQ